MQDFSGRVVVVTGASSGIGEATAMAFAAAGAEVVLVARRADRLEQVAGRCRALGSTATALAADLADLDRIDAVATRIVEAAGVPDVLVNNAGVPKRRKVIGMSAEDIEGVMALNYFSPVRLTLALLPAMVERGSGDVVNVSSLGAHMVSFGVGAYTASKAALEMFTEAMYVELAATGVRAHLLIPGTTRSEFSTEKAGNDAPFPSDPTTAASPEQVAEALLGCIATDDLMTYAIERDAATGAAKNADPNAFLATMRRRLGGG